MKKYLSLIMAVLMILTALVAMVACDPADPVGPGGDNVGPSTDEERKSIDYLPDEMYGSKDAPMQYHILQWTVNNETQPGTSWMPWEEMDVEQLDGSALGEAVFNRNAIIENMYGVEITTEYGSVNQDPNYFTAIDSDINGGGGTYDLMTIRALQLMNLVTNEKCYDMNQQSEYLHFDEEWWIDSSIEAYATGEYLYAACSEILLRDKGATATLFYNKDLAKDYEEVPNFYELVDNGTWTSEVMLTVAEDVSNGGDNDMMDSKDDFWGMYDGVDTMFFLFNSYGEKFAERDDTTGRIVSAFDNDAYLRMQEIYDTVMYADWYLNTAEGAGGDVIADGKSMFVEGSAFFHPNCLKVASITLNNMKQDYGILPFPMYDEFQDDYYSLVWVHHDSVLFIPAAARDKAYSAVILEALSWESYYSVSTVFYKDILLARAARETEDKQMIELILDTRSYDAGQIWQDTSITKFQNSLLRGPQNGVDNITSIYGSEYDVYLENLDDINDIILGTTGN